MVNAAKASAPYPSVVAVVNLKGGVGKTTLCVNLAYGLAFFESKRVLLIDLDPQANATQYLISQQAYRKLYLSDNATKLTIADLYEERGIDPKPIADPDRFLQRVYSSGESGCLDLVASTLRLGMLAFEGGQTQINDQVRRLIQCVGDRYDIVLIDSPPTVSRMLMAGFEAADFVLVPVKPDFLSTIGLPLLNQIISQIYPKYVARRERWQRRDLAVVGVVYTLFDGRLTMTQDSVSDVAVVAGRFGYPVFTAHLSESTKFTWSSRRTLPIFRTEPSSRYAAEVRELVEEFLTRLAEAKK